MAEPTGSVVGKTTVVRACGCSQEFQHFAKDRFLEQRLTKLRKTRCANCAAKYNAEQQRLAATVPKKGEAIRSLPAGAKLSLTRAADGTWAGTLAAAGRTVDATGEGPSGLTITLARLWLAIDKPVEG